LTGYTQRGDLIVLAAHDLECVTESETLTGMGCPRLGDDQSSHAVACLPANPIQFAVEIAPARCHPPDRAVDAAHIRRASTACRRETAKDLSMMSSSVVPLQRATLIHHQGEMAFVLAEGSHLFLQGGGVGHTRARASAGMSMAPIALMPSSA
jgi:hypothetical protein